MSGKHKRTKACDIPSKVKAEVWERDNHACVLCGSHAAAPNAHYISRAHGGLGIPENIVTLCTEFGNGCHHAYDGNLREEIKPQIRIYLMEQYSDWNEDKLIYRKWDES